jgi:hypothetical protein
MGGESMTTYLVLESALNNAVIKAEIAVAILSVQGIDDPLIGLPVCEALDQAREAEEALRDADANARGIDRHRRTDNQTRRPRRVFVRGPIP